MWQVRGPKLDSSLLPNGLGGRIRERKEGIFRDRGSNFSLNFPAIGPSNSGGPRSNVSPHDKGYAWAPVLWSFDKFWEVGVFSYFVYFRFKSIVNGLVDMRP